MPTDGPWAEQAFQIPSRKGRAHSGQGERRKNWPLGAVPLLPSRVRWSVCRGRQLPAPESPEGQAVPVARRLLCGCDPPGQGRPG